MLELLKYVMPILLLSGRGSMAAIKCLKCLTLLQPLSECSSHELKTGESRHLGKQLLFKFLAVLQVAARVDSMLGMQALRMLRIEDQHLKGMGSP